MDRHSGPLPPQMPTHISDATPVGMTYSSTSPVVNSGASGNSRFPRASVSTGMTTWSSTRVTTTGRGRRNTRPSSRKPPLRLLAKVMNANRPMVMGPLSQEKASGNRTPVTAQARTNQGKWAARNRLH